MKILAYFIALLLSPTVGTLAGLIVLPLLLWLKRFKTLVAIITFTSGIVAGFIAIWFSSVIFRWFSLQPSIVMASILAVGFMFNDLRRIEYASKENTYIEIATGLGNLLGIMIGVIYLL